MRTIKDLKEWLATLPPEFDACGITSVVSGSYGVPFTAKRVIAWKNKDGSDLGVTVNSMGSHLSDEFYREVDIISRLD